MQALDLEERFRGIRKYEPARQLIVIDEQGGVYRGGAAWIMCLYALEDYRELAAKLAHPRLMPLAQRVCELISHNRLNLSHALRLTGEESLPQPRAEREGRCEMSAP